MTLGEKIKKIRTEHNLTQEEFSKKLCVSKTSVDKWESNQNSPNLEVLKQISIMFNTPIDSLLSVNDIKYYQTKDKSKFKTNNTICLIVLIIYILATIGSIFIMNSLLTNILNGISFICCCLYVVFTEIALAYFKNKQISKKQYSFNRFREITAVILLFIVIDTYVQVYF